VNTEKIIRNARIFHLERCTGHTSVLSPAV
jgi:hypothetical protein